MGFKNGSGKSLENDLKIQESRFSNFVLASLPQFLINLMTRMIDDNFRQERFKDGKKWKSRKNDPDSKNKRTDRRGILVKSGELIRSIEIERAGSDIIIGTDKIYAQIHNEGLYGKAFGKYPFKMSQRQYMPKPGEDLPHSVQANMDKWIDKQMDNIFK
jgi:phage gpG-like protein